MAVTNASAATPYQAVSHAPSDLTTVDELKPATVVAASGALIEPEIVDRIDTKHPAIDDNPRAGQCVAANRLDLNDPSVPGHVQVARQLGMSEGEPVQPTAKPEGEPGPVV